MSCRIGIARTILISPFFSFFVQTFDFHFIADADASNVVKISTNVFHIDWSWSEAKVGFP